MAGQSERERMQAIEAGDSAWRQWGPYLSERSWGTVREDYSHDGEAWHYFPHDHARSRAYRWGEDGLAGISDDNQFLCFALALWNGNDMILKERLFGLNGPEGNHGEDVKEYYFYADSTPSHSYMSMLYKYPQVAFPYSQLINENARRGYHDFEYELLDTGIFNDNRYFDVLVEYAKADVADMVIRVSITNRGDRAAPISLLPTLWFRNTWSWGYDAGPMGDVPEKPQVSLENSSIVADHPVIGRYYLYAEDADSAIFTENETNFERLFSGNNTSPYVKDAFHRFVIYKETGSVNPAKTGTKAAYLFQQMIAPGATETFTLRLSATEQDTPFSDADTIFQNRIAEADTFYESIHPGHLSDDEKRIQRQALAGMLWTKQLYYYDVKQWLDGDPASMPPSSRKSWRNSNWIHLNNFDIISMPDKWEYPWYAAWDSAFHCIPLAMVDMEFAKEQLILFTREWYMHPNGQLPAYEWSFGDVNPPVHAWAAMRLYEMDGKRDKDFLKRIFNKMLLNFTWWVNRKDVDGNNIFEGGFLGLDNISLFNRSEELPDGGTINQSDGTAWMGFYCLVMMNISIELARDDAVYEDMAIKFYEHFLWIASAIDEEAHGGIGLWDEEDGFFYDVLQQPDGTVIPLKVRSLVGLMPLIAVETVGQETLDSLAQFSQSIDWLTKNRPGLAENLARVDIPGYGSAHLFAIPTEERLRRILKVMLDENEFLSAYGIRSMSKVHETPYRLRIGGRDYAVQYQAAESQDGLFGGNSNWRGPVWFPINYLLIEALRIYHRYYGDDFTIEHPTGSGNSMTLNAIADDLSQRLISIFRRDYAGKRPVYRGLQQFQDDPHWKDYLLFYEYFHGDNGAGLGASHQTGWTGLVAELLGQKS